MPMSTFSCDTRTRNWHDGSDGTKKADDSTRRYCILHSEFLMLFLADRIMVARMLQFWSVCRLNVLWLNGAS